MKKKLPMTVTGNRAGKEMKYRLTDTQLQAILQLRKQLDTQERGRLMKQIEEAGADEAGFSVAALQARGALQQLENRIRKIDLVLDNYKLMGEGDPADTLAFDLAKIRAGEDTGECAFADAGNTRICMQQKREGNLRTLQLTLDRGGSGKTYICLRMDEKSGQQEYLILGASVWMCAEAEKAAAASYTSIAQAAESAYLPYLLILFYMAQDSLHTDEPGIPDENYYLDEELYGFLAACPPWMPLPKDRSAVLTDGPVKKPMRSAQIPLPEDGVILRAEYGERFGFAYQILPIEKKEEEEYDPFAEEEVLEEYYHLRDLLSSKYLRCYLMLLGTMEAAGEAFQEL